MDAGTVRNNYASGAKQNFVAALSTPPRLTTSAPPSCSNPGSGGCAMSLGIALTRN